MGARRLVYLSDVPGLKTPQTQTVSFPAWQLMKWNPQNSGVISSGMLPKVNSAVEALEAGVNRVHFIDGRMPHSILLEIFTDQGIGTEIVHG